MYWIKGHFDGKAVVLDEPVALAIGQQVRVVVEPASSKSSPLQVHSAFSPHRDSTAELMYGEAHDERDALHIDPLDAVPPDFIRQPGSGAGEIKIADDFDETPDDFKDYV